MYRKSVPYRVFNVFNHALLALLAAVCVLPLINVLAVSFSSKFAAQANLVKFVPVQFTTAAYTRTLLNRNFLESLWVAVERSVLGTVLSMIVIAMAAYSLSKETRVFKGRSGYAWFFIVSMLFTGGLIPNYLL
ncbi:carbohydrate ABC transporter permease, partial [Cohnella sp. CBP 2801]|nr:carbohydrate ABC transporter permease [Cohnella zeiphila]